MSKTAIITGANKGIGLAVAKNLIEKDYQIILACRDKIKGKMAEDFLGSNTTFLELDLSRPSSISQFVNQINSDYSEIDVLYNNAGLIYRDFELTEEGYESMFSVNYFGAYRLALMLLENLHRRYGFLMCSDAPEKRTRKSTTSVKISFSINECEELFVHMTYTK